jgi:hypothetical protein
MDEQDLARDLMRTIRLSVAAGLEPDRELEAAVGVLAAMVGEVHDPCRRRHYQDFVLKTFPAAVWFASGLHHGERPQ